MALQPGCRGNLAGVTLTFVVQSVADRRRERVDQAVRTWEARRSAYLELVASLVEFRREQDHRERDRLLSPGGERPDGGQVRTTRAGTRIKSYQARLLAPGTSQVPTAWEADYEQIRSFSQASDLDDLETRTEAARGAIDRLVTAARD